MTFFGGETVEWFLLFSLFGFQTVYNPGFGLPFYLIYSEAGEKDGFMPFVLALVRKVSATDEAGI